MGTTFLRPCNPVPSVIQPAPNCVCVVYWGPGTVTSKMAKIMGRIKQTQTVGLSFRVYPPRGKALSVCVSVCVVLRGAGLMLGRWFAVPRAPKDFINVRIRQI